MKTVKIKTNLIFGVVAILFAVIVWVIIPQQVKPSKVATEYVNGSFMPKLMCGIIFCSGIICLIKSIFLKDNDEKEINISVELKNIFYLVIIFAYGLLARYVSFILSSVLFGIVSLVYMRTKNWKKYVIVIVFAVTVCLIFKYGLRVRFGGFWGL